MEHYISAYSIDVKNPHGSEEDGSELYGLDAVGGFDLLSLVDQYLGQTRFEEYIHSDTDKTSFTIEDKTVRQSDRLVYGYVTYGRFGISSKGVSTSDNSITYERASDEADTMPYFYMFYLPAGRNKGILLTQKIGTHGIYTALTDKIKAFVSSRVQGAVMRIRLTKPRKELENLNDLIRPKKIKLRGTKIPRDVVTLLGEKGMNVEDDSDEYYFEASLIAKRNKKLSVPESWFTSPQQSEILQLDVEDSNPEELGGCGESTYRADNILVETTIRGRARTVSVRNPAEIEMNYHINDDVDIDESGHPVEQSLIEYCKILSQDIADSLNRISPQEG
jgi:hypothetical protein